MKIVQLRSLFTLILTLFLTKRHKNNADTKEHDTNSDSKEI